MAYSEAQITYNGQTLITGYIISDGFKSGNKRELASIAGYSKTGVLEDCQAPESIYPLESNGLSLKQITEKLINPFGIELVVDSIVSEKANKVYETSNIEADQTIKDYISTLAFQRDIIVSHDEQGRLLFTKVKANSKNISSFSAQQIDDFLLSPIQEKVLEPANTPIADFNESGDVEMNLSINGQALHSDITAVKDAQIESDAESQNKIYNDTVKLFRPKVIIQKDGDDNDTLQIARMERCKELKNIELSVTVQDWEINGNLIRPNNIITVKNKRLFLGNKTEWFIREVEFKGRKENKTATLKCVPTEVYTGGTPQNLFS